MSLNPARRFGLPGGRLPPARLPTLCCSTRTRPSGSTGSPCGRNPRTRPSTARFCKGASRAPGWAASGSSTRRRSPHDPRDHLGGRGAPRVALAAYLLGSVPFGIVMARLFGLGDLRQIGSGNIGATNVLRTGNKTAAALTLILDAGKGRDRRPDRARAGRRGCGADRGPCRVLRPLLPGLSRLQGRQGRGDLPRHASGAVLARGDRGLPDMAAGRCGQPHLLAFGACGGRHVAGLDAASWDARRRCCCASSLAALILLRHRENIRACRRGRNRRSARSPRIGHGLIDAIRT
jgi:hypothetical protein